MTHPALHERSVQADNRRSYNVMDRWGRKWLVCIENKSGEMTGPAVPCGFDDPINTPAHYIRLDPRDPNRLVIDYEGWARDLEAATTEWKTRLDELGYDKFGERYDPEESPAPYLLREVGHRPVEPHIPRSAAAGDPKYLGVEPVETPETELERLRRENALLRQAAMAQAAEAEGDPEEYEIVDEE